jgi:hypothetical protein
VLLRDAALRTGQFLFPFFVMPPFYPDTAWLSWQRLGASWDVTGPSREGFDGSAIAESFRWRFGTDFGFVINLAQQLRGIMIIAAIGALAVLLPFARHAAPLCLGLLSAALAYAAMISLVTVYVPRYGSPIDFSALFAILVALIAVYEKRRSPGSEGLKNQSGR